MWGLTTEEFKHYLWLMQNTPSGHWYKNLDPTEVLALNAKDPREMMKHTKEQARNMHVRVTRELAFNKLYTKAYKTLYPNERPVMTSVAKNSQSTALQPGDRVWLFVGIHTPLGGFAYQHSSSKLLLGRVFQRRHAFRAGRIEQGYSAVQTLLKSHIVLPAWCGRLPYRMRLLSHRDRLCVRLLSIERVWRSGWPDPQ